MFRGTFLRYCSHGINVPCPTYLLREWLSGRALPCLNEMEGQAQAKMSIKTLPFTWQVNTMREWLSGRALPCQGKCRGFESRLPLQIWYHRQAVRQRSAKPLFPGSNPGGTSKKQGKGS